MSKEDINKLLAQGENLFTSGNLSDAEKCFKKLLKKDSRNIQVLNDIGVIAYMRSDFRHALDYFNKALEIDERYPKAIENYSKSLIAIGDHLGALNFIRKSFKSGIMNTELLNMMGNCFVEFKDLKSARAVLEKSLSLNTDQEEIIKLLGKIENDLKENDDLTPVALSNDSRLPSVDADKVNKTEKSNFDYKLFWNNRYRAGGNSGLGSYGILADFKADVINDFIKNNFIDSTIEFGCGDGNQTSLIDYPDYIGLDISEVAITLCKNKFKQDSNKRFFLCAPSDYKDLNLAEADLVVCLDVLYHIVDEGDFIKTLDTIFSYSKKYVILYTILNEPSSQITEHIKYRNIYAYTNKYAQFEVYKIVDQKYPDLSSAAFIIFSKKDIGKSKYSSRFFRTSDDNTSKLIYNLPSSWWSRSYEYEWTKSFCESKDVVLDAACGISHPFKFYLADTCKEVHACDIDDRILYPDKIIAEIEADIGKNAKERLPKNIFNKIHFSKASVVKLPYENSYFDKIFCISVLEHLPDDLNIHFSDYQDELYKYHNLRHEIFDSMKEFKRVLKDDGYMVLTFDYPRINLKYVQEIVKMLDLKYAGPVSFDLPNDAVYYDPGKLYCFRLVLKKSGQDNSLDEFTKLTDYSGHQQGTAQKLISQEDIDQLLMQGENLFTSGKMLEAEKCFQKILDKNPRHTQTLNDIGVIAFIRSDFTKALEYFQKALETDERYFKAIENYSKSLIAVGDHLTALNFIRKSFKLGIINTELLNLMGKCFIELKDLKSAKAVFEKSLSLNSGQEDIAVLKGEIESALTENTGTDLIDVSSERMNIGFISIWFERGQSYVTKTLRDNLSKQHNTFVFARTGGVYGEAKLEKSGAWDVPNLTTYPEYKIPPEVIKKWIADNRLHAVVFNEEYDWELVRAVKETGVKVLTYLDYYKDEWKRDIGIYDAVMCSTQRTYNLVKNVCRASYIGWCVDLDLFKPALDDAVNEYTFFHNAGWLGINYRKMTPAVILAFDAISRIFQDASLLVHAQAGLDKLPIQITEIIRSNPRINYHVATLPAPGLYNKAKVLVFPSKLEGLGLPLPEALACGLPAIATDAPPMNEFIKNGYNGLLVRVAHRITRQDDISFPEEIVDLNDLARKMAEVLREPGLIKKMGGNARRFAETELNPEVLGKRLNDLIYEIRN